MYALSGIHVTALLGAFFLTAVVLLQLTRRPQNRTNAMFFRPYNKLNETERQGYDLKKLQTAENILLMALYVPLLAGMLLSSGVFPIEKGTFIYERIQSAVFAAELILLALLLIAGVTEYPLLPFKKSGAHEIGGRYKKKNKDFLCTAAILAAVAVIAFIGRGPAL